MIRLCAAIVLLLSAASCSMQSTANTNDRPPPPAAVNPGGGDGDTVRRGQMYAERDLREAELAAEDEYEEQIRRSPDLTEDEQQQLREHSDRFLRELCRQLSTGSDTNSYGSVPESCRKWVGR